MKLGMAFGWMDDVRTRATLGVVSLASLASVACSANAAPPLAPSAATGPAVCRVAGATRVLARRVFVPGGVEASEQNGAFSVQFAAASSRCAAVDWGAGSETARSVECPAPDERAVVRRSDPDETMLAWESHESEEPHITLGVVTYDAPLAFAGFGIDGRRHLVERGFRAPAATRGSGETAPVLAPIGHDRFLLAWVQGDVESHRLRAQSVVGWGDPLGPALVLSPEDASVVGRPSLVIAPTGDGLATYIASVDDEFDVLATPVACAMN
jgi:hypothetical protein